MIKINIVLVTKIILDKILRPNCEELKIEKKEIRNGMEWRCSWLDLG